RISRRNRLLAALLGVPGAVVLTTTMHILAPPWCIKPLEWGRTSIVAESRQPVQIDRPWM
ncbi:MAG: hypothetical protein WB773_06790, partial [Isosphaeraceae bacterium]